MTKANGLLGEIWIWIGKRKAGKTFGMIQETRSVPMKRLFVNEFHGSSWKDAGRNSRPWIEDAEFIELCIQARDSVFVFEDATAVFSGNVTKRFLKAMARSRDEGVTIFLAFHSFRKCPNDILDMIDGIVIYKTNDSETDVKGKSEDPRVLEAWKRVMASSDPHKRKKIKFTNH